ncbi:DUF29 family protein [Dankookia sp. GCM10030260]|uniref:DUF29 family protein n=1 Tax=Dankookia sp. GCM10030260 TaxID=3273390 RepID=UPI003621CD55
MPDDLYDTDILAWSQAQADRLRRVAAGERVNDLDWAHEVEDVGKSELRAITSNLRTANAHALKAGAWPDNIAVDHWKGEVATFLANARDRFEPGMQQHVDPAILYADALADVLSIGTMGGREALPLPEAVPLTNAELRDRRFGAALLLDRIRAAPAAP